MGSEWVLWGLRGSHWGLGSIWALGVSYGIWGGPMGFEGLPLGSGVSYGAWGRPVGFEVVPLWSGGCPIGSGGVLWGLRGSH